MPMPVTPLKFDKPVCIVTGGSFGIGNAVCEKFCAQGYQVINLDLQAIHHNRKPLIGINVTYLLAMM